INGDTIVVADDGMAGERAEVKEGRKRLLAAILHDTCFPCFIVSGAPFAGGAELNEHRKRTGSVTLYVGGRDDAAAAVSAAIAVTNLVTGTRPKRNRLEQNLAPRFLAEFDGIFDA